jgi:hypothetical protein
MPAQAPHVGSEMDAPAARSSVRMPSRDMISRTRLEPGKTTKDSESATRSPRMVRATAHMSSHDELVHEPTMTCSTAVPATSPTGTTLSGEEGRATSGSSAERSSSICSSYSASASAASGFQSFSRPRRAK